MNCSVRHPCRYTPTKVCLIEGHIVIYCLDISQSIDLLLTYQLDDKKHIQKHFHGIHFINHKNGFENYDFQISPLSLGVNIVIEWLVQWVVASQTGINEVTITVTFQFIWKYSSKFLSAIFKSHVIRVLKIHTIYISIVHSKFIQHILDTTPSISIHLSAGNLPSRMKIIVFNQLGLNDTLYRCHF